MKENEKNEEVEEIEVEIVSCSACVNGTFEIC